MAKPTDDDSSYFPYRVEDNPTSTTFLVGLQGGLFEAWKEFMEFYGPLILYWCRRKNAALSRPDRQEILQEVACKVSKSIRQFDHTRPERSFRGWLRRITENQICDFLRAKSKDGDVSRLYSDPDYLQIPLPPNDAIAPDCDPECETNEQKVLLRQILKRIGPEFKEKSWEVFRLSFNAKKNSSEVAEMLGMEINAVYQIRFRILKRIREEFSKWGIEPDSPGAAVGH